MTEDTKYFVAFSLDEIKLLLQALEREGSTIHSSHLPQHMNGCRKLFMDLTTTPSAWLPKVDEDDLDPSWDPKSLRGMDHGEWPS